MTLYTLQRVALSMLLFSSLADGVDGIVPPSPETPPSPWPPLVKGPFPGNFLNWRPPGVPPPYPPVLPFSAPTPPTVVCSSFDGYTRLPGLVITVAVMMGTKQATVAAAAALCSSDDVCDGFDTNGLFGATMEFAARAEACAGTYIRTDRLYLYEDWLPPPPPTHPDLPLEPSPSPPLIGLAPTPPTPPSPEVADLTGAPPAPAHAPPTPSDTTFPTWVIGLVVAAVVVLLLASFAGSVWWRRRRAVHSSQKDSVGSGGSGGSSDDQARQLQQKLRPDSTDGTLGSTNSAALDLTSAGSTRPLLLLADSSTSANKPPLPSDPPSTIKAHSPDGQQESPQDLGLAPAQESGAELPGGGGVGSSGGDGGGISGADRRRQHPQPASLMGSQGAGGEDDGLEARSVVISENIMRRMLPPAPPVEESERQSTDPQVLRVQLMRQHSRLKDDQLQLFEILGRGGSGVVYRASWKGLPVAAKIMVLHEDSKEKTERQMMEATMSAGLFHPNIVTTYVCDIKCLGQAVAPPGHLRRSVADKTWQMTILQELCSGGSLRQLISSDALRLLGAGGDGGAVQTRVVHILQLALDIACALEHLHGKNIIHSDLTPANVLLQAADGAASRHAGLQWAAKVADFGLSILVDEGRSHASHVFAGTPHYIAPETQAHGMMSRQSDIFTFGVLMYELVAGSADVLDWANAGALKADKPGAGTSRGGAPGGGSPGGGTSRGGAPGGNTSRGGAPGGGTPEGGTVEGGMSEGSTSGDGISGDVSTGGGTPVGSSGTSGLSDPAHTAPMTTINSEPDRDASGGNVHLAAHQQSHLRGEPHQPASMMSLHEPPLRGGGQGRRNAANVLPPLPRCCPSGLRMLVRRCLAQVPEARPSVAQVRQSLVDLLQAHSSG